MNHLDPAPARSGTLRILRLALLFPSVALLPGCSHVVSRSDVEALAASAPYNSSELASALCGTPVRLLGAATNTPATALPHAELVAWTPTSSTEGAATATITGNAVKQSWPEEVIGGKCRGTILFKYKFMWVDNGRAIVKESHFVEGPTVVKP